MKKSEIVTALADILGLDESDVTITKCTDDGEVVVRMVNVDVDDADDYGEDEDDEEEEELEDEDDKEKELNEEADDTSDLDDGKAPESV